jgi:hypothetical protein
MTAERIGLPTGEHIGGFHLISPAAGTLTSLPYPE